MCETRPINQQQEFKDDQEFNKTLSSPSRSWYLNLNLSRRTNLEINQELKCRSTPTRISRSLLWFHFLIYWRDRRIMEHIRWRDTIRTREQGVFDMPFWRSYMHWRDLLFERRWSSWHDRGRHAEWSKWGSEPITSWLHRTLVPDNNQIEPPLSSSTILHIITKVASSSYFGIH